MPRFLVLAALALIFAYFVSSGLARLRDGLGGSPAAVRQVRASELVACSACGVHVPRSRALDEQGGATAQPDFAHRFYCSEGCRRRARPAPEAIRTTSA